MYELRNEAERDDAILDMIDMFEYWYAPDGELSEEHELAMMMELLEIGIQLEEYCKWYEVGQREGERTVYEARHARDDEGDGATDIESKRWFE